MSKASAYRAKKAEKRSERPTGKITLPSGAEWVVCRPPLEVWIASGKFPQAFLKSTMEGGAGGAAVEQISDDDALKAIVFVRDAILEAVVEPRLVVGTTNEDELDPSEIEPEDFTFLTKWIMANCPGVPVETRGGQVAVDDLKTFRQKRPGGGAPRVELDSQAVQPAAESTAGVA
jgi:hypothetical protein